MRLACDPFLDNPLPLSDNHHILRTQILLKSAGPRRQVGASMTTSSITWTEETVEVAGCRINLIKGGSGDPLLVLHDEMGHPGWLRWHETLAQDHTLYIPWHPGFGPSMNWTG